MYPRAYGSTQSLRDAWSIVDAGRALMHAALSVIVFTVLSGAGLGAFAIVAIADLVRTFAGEHAPGDGWIAIAAIAIALVVTGLCASVLHLANPRNAWRSASRFRTSWLSREAVFALAFLAVAGAWWVLGVAGAPFALRVAAAVAGLLLAWTVIACTAMIYASLVPIRAWHTWRVPLNFLLLAHASGAIVVLATQAAIGAASPALAAFALVVLALAALAKIDYRRYLASGGGSVTLEAALGVAHGVRSPNAPPTVAARLLDAGHSRGTFLTREFVVRPTPAMHSAARWTMAIGLYAMPLGCVAAIVAGAHATTAAAGLATAAMLVGLLAERWLFFVEARHTVRLYHGDART